MTLIAFDRRAQHYIEGKSEALDRINDVDALASESRRHLERAHEAHCTNDWKGYLHSVASINDRLVTIRRICHQWSQEVESAEIIPHDQLAIWTRRSDGAVIAPDGAAA